MSYNVNLFPQLYFPTMSSEFVLKVFSEEWKALASKKGYLYSDRPRHEQYAEGIDIYLGVPNVPGAFISARYTLMGSSAWDENTICLHNQWAKNGRELGYLAWRGISEVCAKYSGSETIQVDKYKFAPNPKYLDELRKVIKPLVRKQFESCDGKMKRLLAKN